MMAHTYGPGSWWWRQEHQTFKVILGYIVDLSQTGKQTLSGKISVMFKVKTLLDSLEILDCSSWVLCNPRNPRIFASFLSAVIKHPDESIKGERVYFSS